MPSISVAEAPLARPVAAPFAAERRVRIAMRAAAVSVAALHAWANRHVMNADGVSYLDIGDAYFRGDWANALNAYWGPMYSWLLGAALAVVRPSMYWEFAVVHAVNLAIFVIALAAFELLLNEVLAETRETRDGLASAPSLAWIVLAYSLFAWSSLQLITVAVVSPDLLMAAFVYAATAVLLRIAHGRFSSRSFVLLGALLGFAYLAKAPMFPIGVVYMTLAATAAWRSGRPAGAALRFAALAAFAFALVAGPYVVALSIQKQRLTFGDSRFITYAWFVNGVPMRHAEADATGRRLVHPPRRLVDSPAVYEFATPVAGTYPLWNDPSYWYEGIRTRFAPGEQVRAAVESLREYHRLFLGYLRVSLLVGLAVLALLVPRPRRLLYAIAGQWPLLVPAAAGLTMFAMVHAFPRYVGAFVVLLWIGLYAAIRLPNTTDARRVLWSVFVVVSGMLWAGTLLQSAPQLIAAGAELVDGSPSRHLHWQVARELEEAGLRPGDRIAEVHAEPTEASWTGMMSFARLLRVQIVAEVPPEHAAAFWAGSREVRDQVLAAFARSGARAVVAQTVPPGTDASGWLPLGSTGYAVNWLDRDVATVRAGAAGAR
jgi:hypothetical protein